MVFVTTLVRIFVTVAMVKQSVGQGRVVTRANLAQYLSSHIIHVANDAS